jgi:hypothetical protein
MSSSAWSSPAVVLLESFMAIDCSTSFAAEAAGQQQGSAAIHLGALWPARGQCKKKGAPLHAGDSFQRLIGNRVGEDIFVSLVEGASSSRIVRGLLRYACRHSQGSKSAATSVKLCKGIRTPNPPLRARGPPSRERKKLEHIQFHRN